MKDPSTTRRFPEGDWRVDECEVGKARKERLEDLLLGRERRSSGLARGRKDRKRGNPVGRQEEWRCEPEEKRKIRTNEHP